MNLKSIFKLFFLFGALGIINAQTETINLWPKQIPNSISNTEYQEIDEINNGQLTRVSKVSVPTLTVFLPEENNSNGTAIVICPGGGYLHLAMDKEGFKVANWLNSLGITAFVLKYRLPSDDIMINKTIGPLQDVQEAIRTVRRNAKKWNVDPEKVGVMGFSAGGHLASTLSTHYSDEVYEHDNTSAKPDFSILMYPVISMDDKITHKGSKNNLLGKTPSEDLVTYYSNEKQIDSLTPPTFLVHSSDDKVVPIENALNYYLQLKNNGVTVEAHFYEKGGHGFGLGVKETSPNWLQPCEHWMRSHHFMD